MTQTYRTIRHDNTHWDLEQFFQTDEFTGWAVIKCNMEDDVKKCNLTTTRECFAHPCLGCDPTDESIEQYRNRMKQERLCICGETLRDGERICPMCVLDMDASFDILHPDISEQEQQSAEAAEIVDWLGDAFDISERIAQEARDFADFCADVDAAMADDADLHATQSCAF